MELDRLRFRRLFIDRVTSQVCRVPSSTLPKAFPSQPILSQQLGSIQLARSFWTSTFRRPTCSATRIVIVLLLLLSRISSMLAWITYSAAATTCLDVTPTRIGIRSRQPVIRPLALESRVDQHAQWLFPITLSFVPI